MTVPTKSDFFTNLAISPFTPIGSPPIASDQHGEDNTRDLDGDDEFMTTAIKPIGGGLDHSFSYWVFPRTGGLNANMVIAQENQPSSRFNYTSFFDANSNRISTTFQDNATDFILGRSANASVPFDLWSHVVVTMNGTENLASSINTYINGVVSLFANAKGGSGYGGGGGVNPELTVGAARPTGGNFLRGLPSRLGFWDTDILTAVQAAEEFKIERDFLISGGIVPSLISPIVSPVVPRLV